MIAINRSGVSYCMRYEIPAMLNSGGGAIVNMAFILGQGAFESSSAYVAARHGVGDLARNAAVEDAKQKLRVNAVGPAFTSTRWIARIEENAQARDLFIALPPIGRLGNRKKSLSS